MASRALNHVFGVDRSLSGKAWHWRGGNMDVSASGAAALDDVVTRGDLDDSLDRLAKLIADRIADNTAGRPAVASRDRERYDS